jgi:anti-sigma B factor antagonist
VTTDAFAIAIRSRGERVVLQVIGELDIATAPRLHEAVDGVLGDGVRAVAIDLTRTSFLDSSGLRVLGQAANRLPEAGVAVAVVCPSENRGVLRVIELVGLDYALPLVGALDQLDALDDDRAR